MNYTIVDSKKITYITKEKKEISLQGYSFIDEYGYCFCIVYGDARKKGMKKFLDK